MCRARISRNNNKKGRGCALSQKIVLVDVVVTSSIQSIVGGVYIVHDERLENEWIINSKIHPAK